MVAALRAHADYESAVGDRRHAAEIYERLLAAMMAASPDPLSDLIDANQLSMIYYYMAGIYRRSGRSGGGRRDGRSPPQTLAAVGRQITT